MPRPASAGQARGSRGSRAERSQSRLFFCPVREGAGLPAARCPGGSRRRAARAFEPAVLSQGL
eukprot:2149199-Lingulodinium_polyedra.AAC.1